VSQSLRLCATETFNYLSKCSVSVLFETRHTSKSNGRFLRDEIRNCNISLAPHVLSFILYHLREGHDTLSLDPVGRALATSSPLSIFYEILSTWKTDELFESS